MGLLGTQSRHQALPVLRAIFRPPVGLCQRAAPAMGKDKGGQGKRRPSAHYSSYVQVLNVDNSTAAASVLLFFDNERYLINVGEGMQRHMREHKVATGKVRLPALAGTQHVGRMQASSTCAWVARPVSPP